MNLVGKVCLVTGAGRGIGLACARTFREAGAQVVLSDLPDGLGPEALELLKESPSYPIQAVEMPCDVADSSQVQALVDRIVERYGRLDVLVANAAVVKSCDPLEMTPEELETVLSVNLKGLIYCGQAAARAMLAQEPDADGARGSIVHLSSVNAVMAIPEIAAYCVAKGGVNQWTKALALRLAKHGVRVNGIGPGSINTEMFQAVAGQPEKLRGVLSRTPMGRPGEPEEIANVALFLASGLSSYLTGQTLYPDGGRLGLNYTVPVD